MKTTLKEFQKNTELKHDLQRLVRIGEDLIRSGLTAIRRIINFLEQWEQEINH